MSFSEGLGSKVTSQGVSVVPAIVWFSQGRRKITLPSDVSGSISPYNFRKNIIFAYLCMFFEKKKTLPYFSKNISTKAVSAKLSRYHCPGQANVIWDCRMMILVTLWIWSNGQPHGQGQGNMVWMSSTLRPKQNKTICLL